MKGGILLINKEKNYSSTKVDTILKKKLSTKKIGHLGTLDPLAEGLLVVLVDDGTKYNKYLLEGTKTYELVVRLGATSVSLDYESLLTSVTDFDYRGQEDILDKYLNSKIGKYIQYPPIYSAIKVNGKKLYDYALNNKEVEIKGREVEIYDIKRTSPISYEDNQSYFSLEVTTSKGFYVRSLAKEIGDYLNVPSMAHNIKRLKVGDFHIDNSIKVDDIDITNVKYINPYDLLNFPVIKLDDSNIFKVKNGQKLSVSLFDSHEYYKIHNLNNEPIAIYKYNKDIDKYEIDLMVR